MIPHGLSWSIKDSLAPPPGLRLQNFAMPAALITWCDHRGLGLNLICHDALSQNWLGYLILLNQNQLIQSVGNYEATKLFNYDAYDQLLFN